MNIKLKNKFLYFNKYKIKCAIGKRGIALKKIEGDGKTPKGTFSIKSMFYRKDRVPVIRSYLKKKKIKKNMGWCDDSRSKFYNKLVKFPFSMSAEKLWIDSHVYDIVIVINYNLKPAIKKKGSAIFLHIAKKNYTPTKGCIAIKKKDMILLIDKIDTNTKIIIS
tara:strand:+ start:244 stop:735 length:492 start_codon:yes stop_codon:yes gene_type:complete